MRKYYSFLIFSFLISLDGCQSPRDEFRFQETDIIQIQQGYKNGEFTVEDLVRNYLDRINAIDKNGPHLNSVIEINPDAISIAKELDLEMKSGKMRVPFMVFLFY